MRPFKSIIERYCPMISENVPVEISYNESGEKKEQCLHTHNHEDNCKRCEGFVTGNGTGNTTEN